MAIIGVGLQFFSAGSVLVLLRLLVNKFIHDLE